MWIRKDSACKCILAKMSRSLNFLLGVLIFFTFQLTILQFFPYISSSSSSSTLTSFYLTLLCVSHSIMGMHSAPFSYPTHTVHLPRGNYVVLSILVVIIVSDEHHGGHGTHLRPRRIPLEPKIMETHRGESSPPTSGGTGLLRTNVGAELCQVSSQV